MFNVFVCGVIGIACNCCFRLFAVCYCLCLFVWVWELLFCNSLVTGGLCLFWLCFDLLMLWVCGLWFSG